MLLYRMLKALLLCTLVLIASTDGLVGRLLQDGCEVDKVRCLSGKCIPKTWVCDGANDCPDDSDEVCHSVEVEPMTDEEVEAMTEEEVDMGESEAELGKLREGTTTWKGLLDALEERAKRFKNRAARNQRELRDFQAEIATIGNRRRSLKRTWLVALSAARNLSAGIPPVQDAWLNTKDFFAVFLNRTKVL